MILKPFADDSPIRIIVSRQAFIGKNELFERLRWVSKKDTVFEKSFEFAQRSGKMFFA
ncbi:hypothetical protein JCM6292_119 [Bacteroides pyogenes JCM 6292]|uniref:Uncharacterized protein n=2 Tax=Bacteroides pyogenes TaxID=310300 RepID=W4PC62_9BACE|nr:hypothetical protein JCM6292_119 [Bacteroides pyogenes JCM 6292]GAE17386.1 hypothetical protein JCM6294_124 [Bacteroides pyogenes DSM 20611 = JCM 6294]